jgi:prepilin-type N-terminal cleavage/methylation domain-containing protein
MGKLMNKFSSSAGFSLIEVLIATIIGTIAVAAGFQLFIDQNKSHIIQAGVSDMQQNARSAIDELVGRIRQAGYRLPTGIRCLSGSNSNPDTIRICYLAEPQCTARLSVAMGTPTADLTCAGSNLTNFPSDKWAYIYDGGTETGEFFYVTGVTTSTHKIQHTMAALSKSYPISSRVMILNFYKYFVDRSDTLHPRLMFQANGGASTIYADNIEDLQFHYVMANGFVSDTITLDRLVREVEVQLTARTERNDLFLHHYRRDTVATRVMVRNLEM